MVTEATKVAVWQGLLTASRVSRYYSAIYDRHLKRKYWQNVLEGFVGVLALGSFISPWAVFVPIAGALLILVLVLGKYWTNQVDFLSSVDLDLSEISVQYKHLFEQTNADLIEESVASYAHSSLSQLMLKTCARVDIPLDKPLAQKTQEEAYSVAEGWYANASSHC